MGWGLRMLAAFVGLVALGLGAWPVTLLAALYLVYSLRRPRTKAVFVQGRGALLKPARPLGRYAAAALLFLLSLLAAEDGGTYSPVVFFAAGTMVAFWPLVSRAGLASGVVPVSDSVLLRSRLFPFSWHALAEVKLESQDQTRGIVSMSGRVFLLAGKAPALFLIISVRATSARQAEVSVIRRLRRETTMLSQRGAHLLPADSSDAAEKLSLGLGRLNVGTEDFDAVSSLPFEAIVFQVHEGRVVSHRAFNIAEQGGSASIPVPDLKYSRQPLFAEVVQGIGERHGWPGPDEFSPFLASLDASRTEPLADRLQVKEEAAGKVAVETPGGAEVRIARSQLRALAGIYR
ncbi:MAG: hypothetical protein JRN21_01850 [Nitrososphaerota archaeon]|nr:hypothetical protein [Nitrososphaerota archaeon]